MNKKNEEVKPLQSSSVKHQPSKVRRFMYGVSWSIIFPIVIAIPASIIMLMILAQVLTSTQNTEFGSTVASDGMFYLEIYFFAFVTILVIAMLLIKRLLRTRKRLFYQSGARVLGVYIWVGIFATGLTMAFITKNPDAIKPPVEQNAQLMQTITDVGGDTNKLNDVSVKYVDDYKDGFKNQEGEYISYDDSNGSFSYGVITIKKGLNPKEEKVIVAHEYLHHVWESQLDQTTLRNLTSQLMTLYGQDDWFKTRVSTYSDTNMLVPTELYAYYCTESPDKYLTPYVISECNKHINRDTLRFVR